MALKNQRKHLILLIKSLVSISLLFIIFRKVNWEKTWTILGNARIDVLLIVLTITGFFFLLSAYKWMLLLKALGIKKRLSELHAIYYIGYFFNNLLPTSVGGDVIRIYKTAKGMETSMNVIASVIAERVTGLAALLSIALTSFLINVFRGSNVATGSFGIFLTIIICALFPLFILAKLLYRSRFKKNSIMSRMHDKYIELINCFSLYRSRPGILLVTLLCSFIFHSLMIINVHLIGMAIGESIDIISLSFIVPIVSLIAMIPVTINGMGLKEGAYITLFQLTGLGFESAMMIAFIARIFTVIGSIVGGIVYLTDGVKCPTTEETKIYDNSVRSCKAVKR